MEKEFDDLDDDSLYVSFEAYKTLLDAGLSKKDALERTGLTAQIVKDLEEEENELEFKADFKEVWDADDDDDHDGGDWNDDDDDNWNDDFSDSDYGDGEEKDYY
ncbi:MAG: hypothetical protein ACK4ND_15060 [Cytophagaceae bacterium]